MKRRPLLIPVLAIALCLLPAGAIDPGADAGATYAGQWGSFGTSPGQFSGPQGIAIGPDGTVYVLDTGNHRVQVFNVSGAFLRQWGSYGQVEGQFNAPLGIAVDAASNVYVADTQNHRVQKFRSNGEFVTSWGSIGLGEGRFQCPAGIAVNASGTVFVTDRNNRRVQVFSPSGSFLTKMGSAGTGEGQFAGPAGIAVDDRHGALLVTDPSSNRVLRFSFDGVCTGSWGTAGKGDRQFAGPAGVAVGSDGTVFVCDSNNHRVQGFRPDGAYLLQWGSEGTGIGQFYRPAGVAVAPDGRVLVVDSIADRVQRFVPRSYPEDALIAAFGASPVRGAPPLTVVFRDESSGATSWSWSFGDGSGSGEQHPVHTYTKNGEYTVSLAVTGRSGEKANATRARFVSVSALSILRPSVPVADFTANQTEGPAPFAVGFTDASTGSPGYWWWQFGDGTGSVEQNPVHLYQRPGIYDVTLTVFGEGGSDAMTKHGLVSVLSDPRRPVADFTLSRTSGPAPLYVRCTDRSSNATSWRWEFGGLAWTSMQSPSVVFRRPGTYTVRLIATNAHGSSSAAGTVTVTDPGAGARGAVRGPPVLVVG